MAGLRADLEREILPLAASAFAIPIERLRMHTSLVSLYDADGVTAELGLHQDPSLLVCTIALNSPSPASASRAASHGSRPRSAPGAADDAGFTGGGTSFAAPGRQLCTWGGRAWEARHWASQCAELVRCVSKGEGGADAVSFGDGADGARSGHGVANGKARDALNEAPNGGTDGGSNGGSGGGSPPARATQLTEPAELRVGDPGPNPQPHPSLTERVELRVGDALLQCGQLRYGELAVTRGRRYLLVCYLHELHEPAERGMSPTASDVETPSGARGASRAPSTCTPSTCESSSAGTDRSSACAVAVSSPPAASPPPTASAPPAGSTPTQNAASGGGRRLVCFGEMEAASTPSGSVPERRGRYTLPGGRPAFPPGWDDPPVMADDEPPAPQLSIHVRVGGREALCGFALTLSSCGEATVRLPSPMRFDPRRSALLCEVCEDGTPLATLQSEPPIALDEWLPTGKRNMYCYAIDVPRFTVFFEACNGRGEWNEGIAASELLEDDHDDGEETAAESITERGTDGQHSGTARAARGRFMMHAVRIVRQ